MKPFRYNVDELYDYDNFASRDSFVNFLREDVKRLHYATTYSPMEIWLFDEADELYVIGTFSPWLDVFCDNLWMMPVEVPDTPVDVFITRLIVTGRIEGFSAGVRFTRRLSDG